MKKLLLLLIGGGVAIGANAQYLRNASILRSTTTAPKTINANVVQKNAPATGNTAFVATPAVHNAAKTTATCFYTQDFGSGLPAGWTSASTSPAGAPGFVYKTTAPEGMYSSGMGAMHSTTASNGWMTYDSDSIAGGSGTGSIVPVGYMQTTAINCAAHTTVRLSFQDYFEKFQDSCFIWVSTTSTFAPGTYTSFPVTNNNTIATNVSTANAVEAHINISSVAAGQATVYIRFVYMGPPAGGYAWMVDDICLAELDPVDVGISDGCIVYDGGSDPGFSSFGTIPVAFADTVFPIAYITNYGSTAEPTTSVNAQIFQGTTSVYNENLTVNVPVNGLDTVADFSGLTPSGYYTTTIASYTVPFATSVTGTDADLTNQADTTRYGISDSVWSQVRPGISSSGGLYVHRTASGSTAALSFSPATDFIVPAGKRDTLTGVSVAFESSTVVGQNVGVQLFKFTPSGSSGTWDYLGLTKFRALTSSDISTSGGTAIFALFEMDVTGSGGQIVLDGGSTGVTYAAAVKGNGNTGTVVVLQGANPANNSAGAVGAEDTSSNDGGATQQFGQGHLPFSNSLTPWIDLHFGSVDYSAVKNVNANPNIIGAAYPNPANTTVNIPFTMANDATVTVILSNAIGQVMGAQTINARAGSSTRATFATGNLADGVYLYTVSANGQQKTGRVSVTH